MIIVLQKTKEQESADLFFDKEGLAFLREVFNKDWYEPIKDEDDGLYDFDHEHLSSREWGGQELRPECSSENVEKIHSLKILYLGKDAASFWPFSL